MRSSVLVLQVEAQLQLALTQTHSFGKLNSESARGLLKELE